jgi:predicted ATPase
MRRQSDLRFTRLELRNWRNFGECTLHLTKRVFLVGPNASGKSNLLDVFRFLRDIVSVGGGFQAAVDVRGGVTALRALQARRFPEIHIVADVGVDSSECSWRYELAFNGRKNESPRITAEKIWQGESLVLERPDVEDKRDEQRLRQTHLEQISANQKFRQLAEFFSSIRYLHVVPQLIRAPERAALQKADQFGGDLIRRIAETPKKTQKRRLERIVKALKVAVPQFESVELQQDSRGFWHIKAKYQHWRPQGAWQTEESFSDGTLRLVGLLWALQEAGGPLLLEEPELSLNPGVVRQVPTLFVRAQRTGRQVIVTTHSEALLADEGIDPAEVFLLSPQEEGTRVERASDIKQVNALLEGGATLAEAIVPRSVPRDARQLSLLDL